MRFTGLLLFVCMLPFATFAQNKFKPAFIVKDNGDSVKGYIEQGNENELYRVVHFKKDISDTVHKLTTDDIFSFGFYGENSFQKLDYANPLDKQAYITFATYLVNGYYSLYSFIKDNRRFFIVKTLGGEHTYLLYDNASSEFGNSDEPGNFKNLLLFFTKDCDKLKDEADNVLFNQASMMKFISSLNSCASPSGKNEVMYKKPKTEMRIYAYAGLFPSGSNTEITGRVIARFIIPSVDRKTSFNVGINYMTHKTSDSILSYFVTRNQTLTTSFISVPASVQYNILTGIVQPYIDGGICFNYSKESGRLDALARPQNITKFTPTFTLGIGIECPVTTFLMIKADWRYESLMHYPTIGVAYFFK